MNTLDSDAPAGNRGIGKQGDFRMATGRIPRLAYRQHRRRLDTIYSTPDPFDTLEGWQRLHHHDLQAMTLDELDDERLRLRLRLSFEMAPDPWLQDRRRRLDRARAQCGRR